MSPVNTVQRPGSPVLSGVFLHLIVAANIVLSPDLPRRRSTRAAEQVAVEGIMYLSDSTCPPGPYIHLKDVKVT